MRSKLLNETFDESLKKKSNNAGRKVKQGVCIIIPQLGSLTDKRTVRRKMTNIMLDNNRSTTTKDEMMTEDEMLYFKLCQKGEAKKIFNDTDLMESLLCVTFFYYSLFISYGFLIEVVRVLKTTEEVEKSRAEFLKTFSRLFKKAN